MRKNKEEKMNCKKGSKWLLVGIAVLAVIIAGVIYALASSPDITPPSTSATVTGTKEAAPFADSYRDQAVVALAATDGEGNGGGGGGSTVPSMSKVDGESDLSIAYDSDSNSYTMARTGMKLNGISYMDTDVLVGSGGPSVFWMDDQTNIIPLPTAITPAPDQDVYTYLMTLDLTAMVGSPMSNHWTIYSQNDPNFMAQFVSMVGSMGIPATVDAYAKAFTISGTDFTPVALPLESIGRIVTTSQSVAYTWPPKLNYVDGAYQMFVSPLEYNGEAYDATFVQDVQGGFGKGAMGQVLGVEMGGQCSFTANYSDEPVNPVCPEGYGYGFDGTKNISAVLVFFNFPPEQGGAFKVTFYVSGTPAEFQTFIDTINNSVGQASVTDSVIDIFTANGAGRSYVLNPAPVFTNDPNNPDNPVKGATMTVSTPEILPPGEEGSGPVVSGVDKTYYRIGDIGNFSEYISPVTIKTAGINNFYYYSTDKAGNMETVQSVVEKIDTDSDGDGVYNNYDNCPTSNSTYYQGCPSAIQINAEDWTLTTVDDKNHPKSTKGSLAGLPVKIYDYNLVKKDYSTCKDNWKEEGDDGEEGDSEDCIKPTEYDAIVAKYTPLYTGTTDATGMVKIGVYANDKVTPPVKYLVIGDWEDASSYSKLHNKLVKKVHVHVNKTKKVKMRLECVYNSTDKKCYATKKTTVTGSGTLDIIEPEYIEYIDGQEYYPVIFQSSDNFVAETSVTPPDGWTPDITQIIRQIPAGTTDTAQFNLIPDPQATASSGKVTISAIKTQKSKSGIGSAKISYGVYGHATKEYKSSYNVGQKKILNTIKPGKTSKTFIGLLQGKQFQERIKANKKATEEVKNKNIGQRVKNFVKKIF